MVASDCAREAAVISRHSRNNLSQPIRLVRKVNRDLQHRVLGRPWMRPRSTDCFLVSWPRSGNTWMRHLLFRIVFPGHTPTIDELNKFTPEVDHLGFKSTIRQLESEPYRIIKSHEPLRGEFMKGKALYIVRDGRDAIVSLYHFHRSLGRTRCGFSRFLHQTLRGWIRYGSWQGHVRQCLHYMDHRNLMVLKYENLVDNPVQALSSVLHHFEIEVDMDAINAAVQKSSGERVRKSLSEWAASQGERFSGGIGGGPGQWSQVFSQHDLECFLRKAGDEMKALEYL